MLKKVLKKLAVGKIYMLYYHSCDFTMPSDTGIWSTLFSLSWSLCWPSTSIPHSLPGRPHPLLQLHLHPKCWRHTYLSLQPWPHTGAQDPETQLLVGSVHLDLLLHLRCEMPKITLITYFIKSVYLRSLSLWVAHSSQSQNPDLSFMPPSRYTHRPLTLPSKYGIQAFLNT